MVKYIGRTVLLVYDLAWHIQVEFTAFVNMILVHVRMLVQCLKMEARHREQIKKGCQGKVVRLGPRSAQWTAQYEHEIWCECQHVKAVSIFA